MLFQPSNIAPSTLSGIGIGTVDVTLGLDVSWQVNGDSPMTDYQITLYQNDTASTQMYTTGKITLGTPFQPHDVKGNPMFFSTTISAATLSTAGIVNGYANGYKMLITQWWGAGANDYVEQSSASVFITRSTPTLSIDAIASPVTTSSLTITATYAQAEGDPISTVEWVFAIAGLEDNPIKETGAISTQVLSFNVDGLISGYTYSVMCNVVSSNGMEVSTGYVQFSVSYPYQQSMIDYTLAQMRNSSAVYLSWDGLANNVLEYPYEDSTKTTNGITFTVNGEGDMTANGTASADAYFALADGTLSDLGLSAGQKLLITSGYSGAQIEVTETNGSNVVVSTLRGNDPFQYIVPNTSNTLKISIVIANGETVTSQAMKPMFYIEDKITAFNDVSVEIPPIQNLNGYSNPWPAGGGTNLIPLTVDTIKAANGGANTWNGNSKTINGVTYTILTDEAGNVTGINANGTATAAAKLKLGTIHAVSGTTYGIKKFNADDGGNFFGNINPRFSSATDANIYGNTTMTADSDKDVAVSYYIMSGGVANNRLITPFIAVTSIAPTVFAPYSNICPISGRTGLSVYVSPTQDLADATTYAEDWTSEAGTVYHGTIDLVSGLLTADYASVIFDGTQSNREFVYELNNGRGRIAWIKYNSVGAVGFKDFVSDTLRTASVYDSSPLEWTVAGSAATVARCFIGVPSTITSVADWQTYVTSNPIQLVYELATPVTYQLTAQQIAALAGTNNIWSDAGNVTVTYTKATGTTATITGKVVTISDSNAVSIPTPAYLPGITGVSIYRYAQGDSILRHVYDFDSSVTEMLDYFAPSQTQVSYVIVGHGASDTFIRTSNFTPVFWFYSILLCSQDSSGRYHVRNEYAFKYGVETGSVSNNNAPQIQQNFTPYPTRQPTSSLYKTGSVKGYIGTVSSQKLYSDSVSLQNAIYAISTSTLTKFLKTRKGETIMVECAGPIQMQTGDSMVQQPLVATVDWVEMGDSSESSIVSIPSDGFWPL